MAAMTTWAIWASRGSPRRCHHQCHCRYPRLFRHRLLGECEFGAFPRRLDYAWSWRRAISTPETGEANSETGASWASWGSGEIAESWRFGERRHCYRCLCHWPEEYGCAASWQRAGPASSGNRAARTAWRMGQASWGTAASWDWEETGETKASWGSAESRYRYRNQRLEEFESAASLP
jgi:hypothetical protein